MTDRRAQRVRTGLRVAAVVEAVSWAGLLVAMAFKYVISDNPAGVPVMGPVHGVAFIVYVALALLSARVFRWRAPVTLLGLAASIPSFGSIAFEVWADRRGHLVAPERRTDDVVANAGQA